MTDIIRPKLSNVTNMNLAIALRQQVKECGFVDPLVMEICVAEYMYDKRQAQTHDHSVIVASN
jgi:hypothetical protein